jgi:ubiquinone/menaquinone biosynthesis C-methylase UbiE
LEILEKRPASSLLDIGCFSGSFLSMVPKSVASRQVGVDILKTQVEYAQRKFGADFRNFKFVSGLSGLSEVKGAFNNITIIEVIEHLTVVEIQSLFEQVDRLLEPGGRLILTTPNYTSAWPLLEILIAKLSDVSYEEQHITKFNYFNVWPKIEKLFPQFRGNYRLTLKTTSHFIAPFLAPLSARLSTRISKSLDPKVWRFPFGNLILIVIEKNEQISRK